MSVNSVSMSAPICLCATSDYEEVQIARLLRMYGIEPTGNKLADKAKLHEIELQRAKAQNQPSGKFLTISYSKEQEIIKNKKENMYGSLKNYKKEKGNSEALKEDDVLGRQILAIIDLKKREAKADYEKSKKLRIEDKGKSRTKVQKSNKSEVVYKKPSVLSELNSEQKDVRTKDNIEN